MAKPEQFTAQQMIDTLTETRGMVTLAAKKLNCAPNTVRRYIREYPTVAAALHESHERLGDEVELVLYDEAVKKRNTAALIFLAKTKFKARGYVERTEHLLMGISPELARKFEDAAKAAGVSAGDALEAFVQELANAQLAAGSAESSAEGD